MGLRDDLDAPVREQLPVQLCLPAVYKMCPTELWKMLDLGIEQVNFSLGLPFFVLLRGCLL